MAFLLHTRTGLIKVAHFQFVLRFCLESSRSLHWLARNRELTRYKIRGRSKKEAEGGIYPRRVNHSLARASLKT